jgi:hypothetical protein
MKKKTKKRPERLTKCTCARLALEENEETISTFSFVVLLSDFLPFI